MRALVLACVLACGRPTPAIAPDPVPVRAPPPPELLIPTKAVACILAEFTCAERSAETLTHGEIAKRCNVPLESVAAVGPVIDQWIEELYSARCLLGVITVH